MGRGFLPPFLPRPDFKKGHTMCEHKKIFKIQSGWYCPDCGQAFTEKPKTEPPKKAKSKGKKEA